MATGLTSGFYYYLLDEYCHPAKGNQRSDAWDELSSFLGRLASEESLPFAPHAKQLHETLRINEDAWHKALSSAQTIVSHLDLLTVQSVTVEGTLAVVREALSKPSWSTEKTKPTELLTEAMYVVADQMINAVAPVPLVLNTGTQDHAIILELDFEQQRLVVCNSGLGVGYHQQHVEQRQLVVVVPASRDSMLQLVKRAILVQLAASSKPGSSSMLSSFPTDIDTLYRDHLLPLSCPGGRTGSLLSLRRDAFFFRPQLSGSCTFYALYYWMVWRVSNLPVPHKNDSWISFIRHRLMRFYAAQLHDPRSRAEGVMHSLQLALRSKYAALHAEKILSVQEDRDWLFLLDHDMFPAVDNALNNQRRDYLFPGDNEVVAYMAGNQSFIQSVDASLPPTLRQSPSDLTSVATALEQNIESGNVYSFVRLLHGSWGETSPTDVAWVHERFLEKWYWVALKQPDEWFRHPSPDLDTFHQWSDTLFAQAPTSFPNHRAWGEEVPTIAFVHRVLIWFRTAEQTSVFRVNSPLLFEKDIAWTSTNTDLWRVLNNFISHCIQSYFDAHSVSIPRLTSKLMRYHRFLPQTPNFHRSWLEEFDTRPADGASRQSKLITLSYGMQSFFSAIEKRGRDRLHKLDPTFLRFFNLVSQPAASSTFAVFGHLILNDQVVDVNPKNIVATITVEESSQNLAETILHFTTLLARGDLDTLLELVTQTEFVALTSPAAQLVRLPSLEIYDHTLVSTAGFPPVVQDMPVESRFPLQVSFFRVQQKRLRETLVHGFNLLLNAHTDNHAAVIAAYLQLLLQYDVMRELGQSQKMQWRRMLESKYLGMTANDTDLHRWLTIHLTELTPFQASVTVFCVALQPMHIIEPGSLTNQLRHGVTPLTKLPALSGPTLASTLANQSVGDKAKSSRTPLVDAFVAHHEMLQHETRPLSNTISSSRQLFDGLVGVKDVCAQYCNMVGANPLNCTVVDTGFGEVKSVDYIIVKFQGTDDAVTLTYLDGNVCVVDTPLTEATIRLWRTTADGSVIQIQLMRNRKHAGIFDKTITRTCKDGSVWTKPVANQLWVRARNDRRERPIAYVMDDEHEWRAVVLQNYSDPRLVWTLCKDQSRWCHVSRDSPDDMHVQNAWIPNARYASLMRNVDTHVRRIYIYLAHKDILTHFRQTLQFSGPQAVFCSVPPSVVEQLDIHGFGDPSDAKARTLDVSRNGLFVHTPDADTLLLYMCLAVATRRCDIVQRVFAQFLCMCVHPRRQHLENRELPPKGAPWQLVVCYVFCFCDWGSPFTNYFRLRAAIYLDTDPNHMIRLAYEQRRSFYPRIYRLFDEGEEDAEDTALPLAFTFDRIKQFKKLELLRACAQQKVLTPSGLALASSFLQKCNDDYSIALRSLAAAWQKEQRDAPERFHLHGLLRQLPVATSCLALLEIAHVQAFARRLLTLVQPVVTTASADASLMRLEAQQLGQMLLNDDNAQSVSMQPRPFSVLLFEACADMLVQRQQVDVAERIQQQLDGDLQADSGYWVNQILMGRGKTSVITPLIVFSTALRKRTRHLHQFIVQPAHLVKQSMAIFATRLSSALQELIVDSPQVDRSDSRWTTTCKAAGRMASQFSRTLGNGCVWLSIVSDDTLKTLKLVAVEQKLLPEVMSYFSQTARFVFDEVDTLMNPLANELNFPLQDEVERLVEQGVIEQLVVDLICFAHRTYATQPQTSLAASASVVRRIVVAFQSDQLVAAAPYRHALAYYQREYLDNSDLAVAQQSQQNGMKRKRAEFTERRQQLDEAVDSHHVYVVHRVVCTMIHCWTLVHGKDYGLGNESRDFPAKNSRVAIPFRAVNVPHDGSEFNDPILCMVLTAMCYVRLEELRPQDRDAFVGIVRQEYHQHRNVPLLLVHPHLGPVLRLVPTHPDWEVLSDIPMETELWSRLQAMDVHAAERLALVRLLLQRHVFPKDMWLTKRQINASFLDLVCPSFSGDARVGISGTVNLPRLLLFPSSQGQGNSDIEHAIERARSNADLMKMASYIVADQASNRFTSDAMLGVVHSIRVLQAPDCATTGADDAECLGVQLLLQVVSERYDVLIDAGAMLRNWTPGVVARRLAQQFHLHDKRNVIFIDEHDQVCICEAESGLVRPYDAATTVVPTNTMFYYDHPHTVGVDIKQPFHLRGLCTVNYFNTYTEIAQAIFRMRNLNVGHRVDFFCFDPALRDAASVVAFLKRNEMRAMTHMQRQINAQCLRVLRRFGRTDARLFTEQSFNERVDTLFVWPHVGTLRAYDTWVHKQTCISSNTSSVAYTSEIKAMCQWQQNHDLAGDRVNALLISRTVMQNESVSQSTQSARAKVVAPHAFYENLHVLSRSQYVKDGPIVVDDPLLTWPDRLSAKLRGVPKSFADEFGIYFSPAFWYGMRGSLAATHEMQLWSAQGAGVLHAKNRSMLVSRHELSAFMGWSVDMLKPFQLGVYDQDMNPLVLTEGEMLPERDENVCKIFTGAPLSLQSRMRIALQCMQLSPAQWAVLRSLDGFLGFPFFDQRMGASFVETVKEWKGDRRVLDNRLVSFSTFETHRVHFYKLLNLVSDGADGVDAPIQLLPTKVEKQLYADLVSWVRMFDAAQGR